MHTEWVPDEFGKTHYLGLKTQKLEKPNFKCG